MNIRFILTSGAEFTVECSEYTVTRNASGQLTGYEINGITKNKPIYVNLDCLAAMVRENSSGKEAKINA